MDADVQEFNRDGVPVGCMPGMHCIAWMMAGGLLGLAVIAKISPVLAGLIVARIGWAMWRAK